MHLLQQDVTEQGGSGDAPARAHGGEAVRVFGVRQAVQHEGQHEGPHDRSRQGAATRDSADEQEQAVACTESSGRYLALPGLDFF